MPGGLGDLRGWQTWRLCCELTVPPAPQGLASVFSNRTSRKSASRTDSDNMADGEGYRNPTEVQMSQLVLPCHTNQRGELSVGQLLKWIDATACLSGEAEPGMAALPALATHTRGEAVPESRSLLSSLPSLRLLHLPVMPSSSFTCSAWAHPLACKPPGL